MKNSGKAAQAALSLIGWSAALLLALLVFGFLAMLVGKFIWLISGALFLLWVAFVVFTFYFFRDPDPMTPDSPGLVIAPGHGKVDVIDMTTEPGFMGGECQRISIFLSVFDVHVQNSPVMGRIAYFKHSPGQYLNAMRSDCASCNENVYLGIEAVDPRGEKIGVRLIAGLIARRIIPWVAQNDPVQRGERISLIQFGSRVDVYLPKHAVVKVQLGDRVIGGQTVLASFN